MRQTALDPREQAGREIPVVLGVSRLQGIVQHRRAGQPGTARARPSTSARNAASRWPCARVRGGRSSAAPAIPSAATSAGGQPGQAGADGQDRCEVREVRQAMAVCQGRRGPFLGCTGYPKCRGTAPVPDELKEQLAELAPAAPASAAADMKAIEVGETCDDCGSTMVVRRGRRGYFLGCSKYPKCKGTKEPSEATQEKITAVMGARGCPGQICPDPERSGRLGPLTELPLPTGSTLLSSWGRRWGSLRSQGDRVRRGVSPAVGDGDQDVGDPAVCRATSLAMPPTMTCGCPETRRSAPRCRSRRCPGSSRCPWP